MMLTKSDKLDLGINFEFIIYLLSMVFTLPKEGCIDYEYAKKIKNIIEDFLDKECIYYENVEIFVEKNTRTAKFSLLFDYCDACRIDLEIISVFGNVPIIKINNIEKY